MEILLLVFVVASVINGVVSNDPKIVTIPVRPQGLNNTKLVINCTVTSSTDVHPEVEFAWRNNKYITNSSDNRITVVKYNNSGKSVTAIITFNPIYVSDMVKQMLCDATNMRTDHQMGVSVYTEKNIPQISVKQTVAKVEKGGKATYLCDAKAVLLKDKIIRVDIKWFRHVLNLTMPAGVTTKDNIISNSHMTSELTISQVNDATNGIYYCYARFYYLYKIEDINFYGPFYWNKVLNVEVDGFKEGIEKKKTEKKVKAGDKMVQFNCDVAAYPVPTLKWTKGDEEIIVGKKMSLSTGNVTTPDNLILTINDVTYSDRATYKCLINYKGTNTTKEFTLRVRDPLGALWPFLGILVEAIVLAIILFVYEFLKKKNSAKKINGDENMRETSPLVSTNAPKVSYTKGDETVRERTNVQA